MTVRRVTLVVTALVLVAAPAWAHVTVTPEQADRGSTVDLTFRVPNEKDDATTVKVEIVFPADHPVTSAEPRPADGWAPSVTRRGDAVDRVTWEGGSIPPDGRAEFVVRAGPLPGDADRLVFKALQHYSDGEVVAWIEEAAPGGEEPDHPAPVLELTGQAPAPTTTTTTPATTTTTTTAVVSEDDDDEGSVPWVPIAAAVAVAIVIITLVLRRRRA
jgi:uncharacterized protein YcnI